MLALLLLQIGTAQVEAPRPNVAVIIWDDVSRLDVELVDTPAFDSLAARGTYFERFYAMPVCSPSRRCLLTGEYIGRGSGIPCAPGTALAMPLGQRTLPRSMSAAGYTTALIGKWHVGSQNVMPPEYSAQVYGFDLWQAGLFSNVRTTACGLGDYYNWTRVEDGRSSPSTQYQTEATLERALEFVSTAPEPWLLTWSLQAAHGPFHNPPSELMPAGWLPTTSQRGKYEGMIQSADFALGELLRAIDLQNTVIVVVGDNGTPPQVPPPGVPATKVKTTTFETGVRVPCVVAGPGIPVAVDDRLGHIVDLPATLARLARFSWFSTHSFDLFGIQEHSFVFLEDEGSSVRPHDRAVVTSTHKLREVDLALEVYDLVLDPNEEAPVPFDPGNLVHQELFGYLASIVTP